MGSGEVLGKSLIAIGGLLGLVGLAWLGVTAASGDLQAGGAVLGLFFLLIIVLPIVAVGFYALRQGEERQASVSSFDERRRVLEKDRLFRHTLHLQTARLAELFQRRAAEAPVETARSFREVQRLLAELSAGAGEKVSEAQWLQAAPLAPENARDVERYDDLLLAAVRQIRQAGDRLESHPGDAETVQRMMDLARSAERQFALRQDLVLRGRKLPRVGPLQLLGTRLPEAHQVSPEGLESGGAVSRLDRDYLVTSHVTYFAEGRTWHGLVLRGEEGERRLQVEPGADRLLFMEPVEQDRLPGKAVSSGTASATVDSLSGGAEDVLVEYRRTELGDSVGWWEQWPGGDKSYIGEWVDVSEFRFWPGAVGTE
ncbi:MAG TPA: hypothetical protein VFD42_00550 [Chloroflexota bacterium]|nr:hypothetical protein [Chloroflexota bacterium]